ncbi:MAG: hypothetical protein WC360_00080 [Opitutales bacterium]|jgi:hypothetical protein
MDAPRPKARWKDLRPGQKVLAGVVALLMLISSLLVAALVLALTVAPAVLVWWFAKR